ncbi:hypothetical protein GCM10025768_16450 [Microbacterium pseudoresistens]|uniref:Glycerol uptake facilitator-like aquaporin n=1 Tax=Microbacterium pseudoresistens TaxID=640634 RepID=A0A7Y9JLX5_9MICO|nr:hypothetical protein [Microbacterium pseudoresistens]NYD53003.1 glycerol uptake facilitator-like aquaporin [Microbacterium pseudoresistens]
MYILLALIAACALGVAVHYLMRGRELRGVALVPAVSTAVAAAGYAIGQWAGLGEDNAWLWLISVGGGIVAGVVVAVAVSTARARSDERLRASLGI